LIFDYPALRSRLAFESLINCHFWQLEASYKDSLSKMSLVSRSDLVDGKG
jgi:hypothetical protein